MRWLITVLSSAFRATCIWLNILDMPYSLDESNQPTSDKPSKTENNLARNKAEWNKKLKK